MLWVIFIHRTTVVHGDRTPVKKLSLKEAGLLRANQRKTVQRLLKREKVHPIYRQTLITVINVQ